MGLKYNNKEIQIMVKRKERRLNLKGSEGQVST